MNRRHLGILIVLLATATLPAAAGTRILLVARDNEKNLLSGFVFAYQGVESSMTNRAGASEIDLPLEHPPGKKIEIQLVASPKKIDEWFLVNYQINIPEPSSSVEIVLMKRSEFRQIAGAARDAPKAARRSGEVTAGNRRQALVEEAARRGLTADQLETAIRSFAETQDPKDRGIAAYLEDQYATAEVLLSGVAEKEGKNLVETLRYLGATQYEQGKYKAAADTFRKALILYNNDAPLLNWWTNSFYELSEWVEAEPFIRQALTIDEKGFDTEHFSLIEGVEPLLQAIYRLEGIESLMRQRLSADEKSLGEEHPKVATDLNNLAQLIQASGSPSDAEPLMQRALAIHEKIFGAEHPEVGTDLNNLAQLFYGGYRTAEAESLMRRALEIAEKSLGAEHPTVAVRLNNLAQLLMIEGRLSEAEPLMRRAAANVLEREYRTGHKQLYEAVIVANFQVLLHRLGKSNVEIEATTKSLGQTAEVRPAVDGFSINRI